MGFIYMITNINTQQMYIGQTIRSVEERFIEHSKGCISGYSKLDYEMDVLGKENFHYQTLLEVEDNLLDDFEVFFIQFFNTYYNPFHYNLTKGGTGVESPSGKDHYLYNHNLVDEDIINMANLGLNQKEIADLFGVNFTAIFKRLQKMIKNNKITQEWYDEYLHKCLSKASTGNKNSMYGKREKDSPAYNHNLKDEDILRLAKEGKTHVEIAKILKVGRKTIGHRLYNMIEKGIITEEWYENYKSFSVSQNFPTVVKDGRSLRRDGSRIPKYILKYKGKRLKSSIFKEKLEELVETGEYLEIYKNKFFK